jgi:hypothetical protein
MKIEKRNGRTWFFNMYLTKIILEREHLASFYFSNLPIIQTDKKGIEEACVNHTR